MPRIIETCPNTPDLELHSKYCKEHEHLSSSDSEPPTSKRPRIVLTIDIKLMKVSTAVDESVTDAVPGNSDKSVHVACKSSKNVDRYT